MCFISSFSAHFEAAFNQTAPDVASCSAEGSHSDEHKQSCITLYRSASHTPILVAGPQTLPGFGSSVSQVWICPLWVYKIVWRNVECKKESWCERNLLMSC